MTALRHHFVLAACLAAGALMHTAPVQAQSIRDNIRLIEQEYARQSGGRAIPDDQLEYYLDRMASGWTISRVSADIGTSRRTYASSPWRPVAGYTAREVICTSIGNRYRECAVPFRGTAMLREQLSNTACIEGRTWGQKPGAVWVNNGCRAIFGVVANTTARRGTVTCTSNQGRYRECPTGSRASFVLANRLNNSGPCVEGRTWGNKPGAVWVRGGCRAQFINERRADRLGDTAFARDPNYGVTCASAGGGRTVCTWDTRYGRPMLLQQLSSTSCIEGRDWGYDVQGQLWVNSGCRARFGWQGGSASSGRWVRDPNYAVTCTSLDGRRTTCAWDTRYGALTMIESLSGSCVEGRDWGYDRNGEIWVTSSCRARFGYR